MFRSKAIGRALEGDIDNRFQPPEPVRVRVSVRLAVVILPGLRSSQNSNKILPFQLLGQLNDIFSATEMREGYYLFSRQQIVKAIGRPAPT